MPAPNASHVQPGWRRLGAQRKSSESPVATSAITDRPANHEPERPQRPAVDEATPEGEQRKRQSDEAARAQREHERALVLLRERAVFLVAVELGSSLVQLTIAIVAVRRTPTRPMVSGR